MMTSLAPWLPQLQILLSMIEDRLNNNPANSPFPRAGGCQKRPDQIGLCVFILLNFMT